MFSVTLCVYIFIGFYIFGNALRFDFGRCLMIPVFLYFFFCEIISGRMLGTDKTLFRLTTILSSLEKKSNEFELSLLTETNKTSYSYVLF